MGQEGFPDSAKSRAQRVFSALHPSPAGIFPAPQPSPHVQNPAQSAPHADFQKAEFCKDRQVTLDCEVPGGRDQTMGMALWPLLLGSALGLLRWMRPRMS